jgi:hypothetical protein
MMRSPVCWPQQTLEALTRLGEARRGAGAIGMRPHADMVGDEADDALAVLRAFHLVMAALLVTSLVPLLLGQ